MNENPEGTPNPLNPNPLDANPSEPVEKTNETYSRPPQNEQMRPISRPLTEELVEESVMVESLDPEGRPMEKVTEAPKKKKKTGLIIGMVVCLFVAVGCGVAAILMMMNSDKDPVAAAMQKLMSGKVPENVVIDGDIELLINDEYSPISKLNIDLDAKTKSNSLVNEAEANITLTLANDDEIGFGFSEVYSADGNLYFKINGIASLIEQINLLQSLSQNPRLLETNCIGDASGETNCLEVETIDCEAGEDCDITDYLITDIDAISGQTGFGDMFGMMSGVVEVIDGEWLKLSMNELTSLTGNMTMDSNLSCMIDMVDDINTNSSSAASLYNKNPFLSSTTENITINSKLNPVRQIAIDDEAFANFINSIQNSELTNNLYDCLGWRGNVSISAADVREAVRQIPAIYVEVDKNNNFSRLYMKYAAEEADATITIDLSFSYPPSIDISEPEEYISFEQIIQTIFTSMYDFDDEMMVERFNNL